MIDVLVATPTISTDAMRSLSENVDPRLDEPASTSGAAIEKLEAPGLERAGHRRRARPAGAHRPAPEAAGRICIRRCSMSMARGEHAERGPAPHHRGRQHRGTGAGLEEAQAEEERDATNWLAESPTRWPSAASRSRPRNSMTRLAAKYGVVWHDDLFAPGRRGQPLHHQRRWLLRRPAGVAGEQPAQGRRAGAAR